MLILRLKGLTVRWSFFNINHYTIKPCFKVMLLKMQRQFLAQQIITRLLRHCFEQLQHCSNIATLCCAKNRRCESTSGRVTSPLRTQA